MATNSPRAISNETPRRASTSMLPMWYTLHRSSTAIIACGACKASGSSSVLILSPGGRPARIPAATAQREADHAAAVVAARRRRRRRQGQDDVAVVQAVDDFRVGAV